MDQSQSATASSAAAGQKTPAVTAFVCANCARGGVVPSSGLRQRPQLPAFNWPIPVNEVPVPCAGRLQPEHLLKAFEAGADLVCVVACQEDNCHYMEGSRRGALRVDHVRGILDQIGLGGQRLMIFHLPGSAREDLTLGASSPFSLDGRGQGEGEKLLTEIRDQVVARLKALPPNPLRQAQPAAAGAAYEVEEAEEDSD